MKKRKGFTLVELLVVIAILAVILLIAVPIIVGNINESKEKAYGNQISLFKEGAERYSLEHKEDLIWEKVETKEDVTIYKSVIRLQDLADKDYVDLPVINPKTGYEFDPYSTVVIVYKNADGSLTFEYQDEDTFRIINGTRIQTIARDESYGKTRILADIYVQQESDVKDGENLTVDDIEVTCKYGEKIIGCENLESPTKETGTYYITYSLTNGVITVTETRTIIVVDRVTPVIKIEPESTKTESAKVTIFYPEGTTNNTYSTTKGIKDKKYNVSFVVTKNQTITAKCIDKHGLACIEAEKEINNIIIVPPTITAKVEPTTLINGYGTKETVTIKYRDKASTGEAFYVKTTKVGTSNVTAYSCGTSDKPGTCSSTSTKSLLANTWYKVSGNVVVTYTETSTSNNDKIYAVIYDDTTYSDVVEYKLNKIDTTGPKISLTIQAVYTNNALLGYEIIDLESGPTSVVTCKYGTSKGNYTSDGTSVSTAACILTGLKTGTTYYYQICTKDKLDNDSCATGSTKPANINPPKIEITKTPAEAQNGYYKQQVAAVEFDKTDISVPEFYIKTTRAATSSVAVIGTCETGEKPINCTTSSTKSLAANIWYKVSGNVNITYNQTASTTATLYAITADGINKTEHVTATIGKIDATSSTVSVTKTAVTTNNATLTYGITEEHSGIKSYTCKYGTKSGSYTTNGTSVTTTSCTMPGLKANTTYYYQVCVADKVGNATKCATGSVKTSSILPPDVKIVTDPAQPINGWVKKAILTITFNGTNITSPQYFIKTTRAGTSNIAVSATCGTGSTPANCTTSSTKSLAANTWYKISGNVTITYTGTVTTTGTLYALTYDGTNYSTATTGTIPKTEGTSPTVKVSATSTSTNSATLTYVITEEHSGIKSYTCKYGTKSGSYPTNGSSVTKTSCKMTGLTANTTYYYQVCATDAVENPAGCATGSVKTGALTNPWIKITNDPTAAVNEYYRKQTAAVTFYNTNITSPQYFIKTTKAGTSNIAVSASCGTGNKPGTTCSSTSTKSLAANTWYKVSGNVTVTYTGTVTTTGTIYALTYDGTNYTTLSGQATGTLGKTDNTGPTVKINSTASKTNSITLSYGISDAHSGAGTSVTCKYGTTNGSYTTNGSSVSTTACSMTGLTANTTYYYQVCGYDKLNNQTCTTGSAKTGAMTNPEITMTPSPAAVNGWTKTETATVKFYNTNITSPQYFIKTTQVGTSNISVSATCGTGSTPGTCSATSTKSLAANTWYKVSGNVTVTYTGTVTTTGTIYALTYDGTNYTTLTGRATGTIHKRDNDTPEATMTVTNGAGTVISSGGNIGKSNQTTITFACKSLSGTKSYSYYNQGEITIYEQQTIETSYGTTVKDVPKKVNIQFQKGITASPHKFIPANIGIDSTTTTAITHYLTCTNNVGTTSQQATFITKIINAPTVVLSTTSQLSTSITVRAMGAGTGTLNYRFKKDSDSWGSYSTSATNTFSGLTASTKYTLYVQVKDSVGQTATASSSGNTGGVCPSDVKCGPCGDGSLSYNPSTGGCQCSNYSTGCVSGGGGGGPSSSGACTGSAAACLQCLVGSGSCAGYPPDMNALDVSECLNNLTCGGTGADGQCIGNPLYCN